MKKIPTLFARDPDNPRLLKFLAEIAIPMPVFRAIEERGIMRRKYDGSACLVRDGKLYKRYTHRPAKGDPPPQFEPATGVDPKSGKQEGWLPVYDSPEDKWHREALENAGEAIPDGTYELCGPKVQGNPEGCGEHVLIRHDSTETAFHDPSNPGRRLKLTYDVLQANLASLSWEGVVFYVDGEPVAKLKKRDFGGNR